jgi:hypothetical protein
MKIITFITLHLVLLVSITHNMFLKTKRRRDIVEGVKNGKCFFIESNLPTSYPPDVQKGAATIAKADLQSRTARYLLYSPNAAAKKMLISSAKVLKKIMTFTSGSGDEQKESLFKFFFFSSWNRQLSTTGTWSHVFNKPMDAIDRIIAGNGKSQDYLGLLALLGDVGSQLADSHNPAKVTELNEEITKQEAHNKTAHDAIVDLDARIFLKSMKEDEKKVLNKQLKVEKANKTASIKGIAEKKQVDAVWQVLKKRVVKHLYPEAKEDGEKKIEAAIQNMREYVAGDALAPNKTKQRGNCFSNANDKKKMFIPRSAVFNRTVEVEAGFNPDAKLTLTSWPMQTVASAFLENCNDEPWAGHISGSIGEIMFVLQLFTEPIESIGKYPYPNDNNENRKLRAALASTFLLATGMHTALEVSYPVKMFIGEAAKLDTKKQNEENAVKDAICKKGEDPTTYVTNLIKRYVDTSKNIDDPSGTNGNSPGPQGLNGAA